MITVPFCFCVGLVPDAAGKPVAPERMTLAVGSTRSGIGSPVRAPGYRNFDLAIIKRTHLNETTDIEFRTEVPDRTVIEGQPAVRSRGSGRASRNR